ncbi:MAG TPA: DUF480 domain-containing protein [Opitutales bacterium]|jgi:uncharacterized protein YceH (UPF0502 family)|nr:DUF480 domain-containing protein [Opitutales bacterium]
MPPLNDYELRVLGALVEKQISTPDYYPLTLNALVNACNQKNQRDPVVSYTESDVQRALESLRDQRLAFLFDGAVSRVAKYGHSFPKTLNLDPPETALLCVLLLRGPQTPGELRSRSAHLHAFESLPAVEETLQRLATREESLIAKLPRLPGTKESRYAHRLGGEIKIEENAATESPAVSAPAAPPSPPTPLDRVAKLEAEVASLRQELSELKTQFSDLKKQLE